MPTNWHSYRGQFKGRVSSRPFFASDLLYKARLIVQGALEHGSSLKTLYDAQSQRFLDRLALYLLRRERDYHSAVTTTWERPSGWAQLIFPTILGAVLAVIGAIAVIRSFIAAGTPIGGFSFKGLVLVTLSVVLFGVPRARRGIGGRLAAARDHQRVREHAFPMAHDAHHGGGTDDLLRARLCQRLRHPAADHRSLVGRLTAMIISRAGNDGITR